MKQKDEAVRQHKKIQSDIIELQVEIEQAKRASADSQNSYKKALQSLAEAQSQIEDEQKQKNALRESAAAADRRANALVVELNDARTSLQSAERARKAIATEVQEAENRVNEAAAQVASINALKRKSDNFAMSLQSELSDARDELKHSEEKHKKALAESSLIVEQLRKEQVNFHLLTCKLLEFILSLI